MVSWMKTTIDIAEPLLQKAKLLAVERRTTLKALVEEGLTRVLGAEPRPRKRFRLRKCAFGGSGLQPGLSWGDWDTIRDLSYGTRGG